MAGSTHLAIEDEYDWHRLARHCVEHSGVTGSGDGPTEKLGLPNFTIVGLINRAIQEAREHVRVLIRNARFEFPCRRLTVNLAPAEVPKDGTGFDLAVLPRANRADDRR